MSSAVKSPVKSALEYAFVAFLVWGACVWFLITEANAPHGATSHVVMFALGSAVSLFAHWTYMVIALKRAGRSIWLWLPLLVLLFPVTSVIAGVMLSSQLEDAERAERAQRADGGRPAV